MRLALHPPYHASAATAALDGPAAGAMLTAYSSLPAAPYCGVYAQLRAGCSTLLAAASSRHAAYATCLLLLPPVLVTPAAALPSMANDNWRAAALFLRAVPSSLAGGQRRTA